ncbi:MAG: hypothetical protein M1814_006209 [Vezdaea aestivalis]|nr:MAG: hypothetical protein M1814_006209 [Vezdaea aestivalis]
MAAVQNGMANGHGNAFTSAFAQSSRRFSDIPSTIDIQVSMGGAGPSADEAVEINLEDLFDDPTELITVMQQESAGKNVWMTVALAYAKQHKVDHAIELLTQGLIAVAQSAPRDRLALLSCLCWLFLWKSREAPRVVSSLSADPSAKTKDFYLTESTRILNEASHINPSFPPLFLARGVLLLLKVSLMAPTKSLGGGSQDASERVVMLKQALKSFDDAIRVSDGKNMMAVLGKARTLFSLGRFAPALESYQEVLAKMPNLIDPDPRIGIGCCLWNLGYKEDAYNAWKRALELNPASPIGNVLLGLYYLQSTSHLPTSDPKFIENYKKAMTVYTQKSYKANQNVPLTCATFGAHFLSMKMLKQAETLARKAIELTDVNAIASDGWYLLARKEHYLDDIAKAADFYRKADEARGGDSKGFLPAKIGLAQLQAQNGDVEGAKFRLEKIVQQSKNIEAIALLGTIYADEVFANYNSPIRESKAAETKKAISYLETVRMAWKDPKKNLSPDSAILLNLARLYESDQPEKSLQCLLQVEQMEIDQIPEEDRPDDIEDEQELKTALRANLPPQLLNNMGCFQYHADRLDQAREMFQTALNACVKVGERDESMDTDALVTSISFNLARTYEAAEMKEEAKKIYQGLLERHADYTDASTRLAYIALREAPSGDGPKICSTLAKENPNDMEVRSLYGWYLSKAKKRIVHLHEDPEQQHHKKTLQQFDKHDRYGLTAMGNLNLLCAREMRRDTDSEKDKRSQIYRTAVSFFDKALQYDPQNAYAAQGMAIALAEEKRDFASAISILTRVRDTIKDPSVLINMGHIYAELKQYQKSIENYESALAKDRGHDFQLLACLGRVWFHRGRQEKSLVAMQTALDYSRQALDLVTDGRQYYAFNVAYVQFQIAQLIFSLPAAKRTLAALNLASSDLDTAISSFEKIASQPAPPFPKHDLEMRAAMGKNTMKKQLDRAAKEQDEFETKNREKLEKAREKREEEVKRMEGARRDRERVEEEQRERVKEERRKIKERDEERAQARAKVEDERRDREGSDDEGGKRRSGTTRSKAGRKRADADDDDLDQDPDAEKPKKKRRLQQKGSSRKNFKSQELIVDSDDNDSDEPEMQDDSPTPPPPRSRATGSEDVEMRDEDDDEDLFDAPSPAAATAAPPSSRSAPRASQRKRIEDDDEDDEDEPPVEKRRRVGSGDEEVADDEPLNPIEDAIDDILPDMASSPDA